MTLHLQIQPDLIFDLGMHRGFDTEFYLRKGFRVVAVEANPVLAAEVGSRLSNYLQTGQLIIENVGIGVEAGSFPFFVNLDNDEWSSFNRDLGTRQGTQFKEIEIRSIQAIDVFKKHGLPHFLKIDIEGLDWLPVAALHAINGRPNFVSVEDNGFGSLIQLHNAGAKSFKFVDQVEKWKMKCPTPPTEGSFVDFQFGAATSGLFGSELPGEWLPLDAAALFYLTNIRPPGIGLQKHWWDIHCKFS